MLTRRGASRRLSRRHRGVLVAAGLAVALIASGCSGGPGDEGDLTNSLIRDGAFTQAQAECIASAVFTEYGEDPEAIERLSGAGSFEELNGTTGVDGFDEFFSNAVSACTNT